MTVRQIGDSLWNVREDIYPLGIKFWAEIYPESKPKFRVFRCLGVVGDEGSSFIFESISDYPKTVMIKRWDELDSRHFKPFLLPLDKIRSHYGEDW